ncbi:MAG: hypothetical protein ACYC8T_07355 [Myxococcaceae bacterium]
MAPRACLATSLAAAREKPAISFRPLASGDEERPVATEIVVGPQGSDYAFRVEFDKLPWGDECKNRCANATIFLDTDSNKNTGLQLKDKKAAETGADIAVTVQGAREYKENSADVLLRVRVRQFSDASTSVDEGETMSELDHRSDPERLHVEGRTVYVLIDATNGTLPSGSKMRVIYHPPDVKPLVGAAKGLLASGVAKIEIFKQGKRSK